MSPAAVALTVYGIGAALLIAVLMAILYLVDCEDPAPAFTADSDATEVLPVVCTWPQAAGWHDKLDDLIAEWTGPVLTAREEAEIEREATDRLLRRAARLLDGNLG